MAGSSRRQWTSILELIFCFMGELIKRFCSYVLAHHLRKEGVNYLIRHELPDNYNINQHKKKNSYFAKYGINVPMIASDFFSSTSGIKSETYLTRELAFNYIYPYLDRYEFCPAYADKNIECKVLNISKIKESLDLDVPFVVVKCMNGIFYNNEDRELSLEDALRLVESIEFDMIIKPSISTFGGAGVSKFSIRDIDNRSYLTDLFERYGKNWVIQKAVEQHSYFASFNNSSVNTIRVVTYRDFDKNRKVIFAVLRFGAIGSIIDNASSGGGFCVIDKDGKLKDRKIYKYKTVTFDSLQDSIPDEVPFYDKIVQAALALHGQMPYFDIMGWDFAVSLEGHPILIEYNIRPGYGLQLGVGPALPKDELDKIMSHVAKNRKYYRLVPIVRFEDKSDFWSEWR